MLQYLSIALNLLIGGLLIYWKSHLSSYAAKKGENLATKEDLKVLVDQVEKSAYAARKSENLATHEDIQKVVDQVSAVTKTQEEIKASISDDLWSRQRRWELKKEAAVRMMECVGSLEAAVRMMIGVNDVPPPGRAIPEATKILQKTAEADFKLAIKDFNRMVGVVQLTCGLAVNDRLGFLGRYLLGAATEVAGGKDLMQDKSEYQKRMAKIEREMEELVSAARDDLKIASPQHQKDSA